MVSYIFTSSSRWIKKKKKNWWIYRYMKMERKSKLFDSLTAFTLAFVASFCLFVFFLIDFRHIYKKPTNVEQWETKTVQRIKPVLSLFFFFSSEKWRDGKWKKNNKMHWCEMIRLSTFFFLVLKLFVVVQPLTNKHWINGIRI